MLYNALSMGKKNPKTASSPWDFDILPEEDQATAIGNMHKNLVKMARVVAYRRYSRAQTDRHTQTCSSQYFATAVAGKVMKRS